jgi:enediyne biosynthesis protein E7
MAKPPPGPRGEHEVWRPDMFKFLAALAKRYGDVVEFHLGRSPCILVNGAAQVRELFFECEACLRKPEFVKDSNRGYWGDGLTTLEGSAWHARRRLLRPCFRARHVPPCLPVVAQCTEDMLKAWAPDGEVDLLKELRVLTARIAARVVLDAELGGYGTSEGRSGMLPFAEAYGEEYVSAPGGDPTAPLLLMRPRAPRRMDATIRIIDERIASGEDRGDVLSDLVRTRLPGGERLSRDEIVGEVIQMLYAGHLTIPSSLVNFWRDIAATDVAATIAAEADHLCATGVPEPAAILGSYCLAALKESMRLHPPAPILYREVERPFELGGFEFSRDAGVWVSPQLLHNDARNFPEPHRFLPERFMKGSLAVTSRSLYIPFGAGRRACVASHLALHQMTLIGLLTARRFNLNPPRDGSDCFRAQARARNGLFVATVADRNFRAQKHEWQRLVAGCVDTRSPRIGSLSSLGKGRKFWSLLAGDRGGSARQAE